MASPKITRTTSKAVQGQKTKTAIATKPANYVDPMVMGRSSDVNNNRPTTGMGSSGSGGGNNAIN